MPLQLHGFRGTLAERHAENSLIQSIVGDDVYEIMAVKIYKDKGVCDLFKQVSALQGIDSTTDLMAVVMVTDHNYNNIIIMTAS